MSEYFEFFSNDFNNWNYNEMQTKPDIDPFNNNKKLDPFGYNLYKYNTIIMLKEILKNTKQYIEEESERARARERDTHAHTHTHTTFITGSGGVRTQGASFRAPQPCACAPRWWRRARRS